MENSRHEQFERAVARGRGRGIVTAYARQSNEFGDDPSELLSAAGDTIGDVLAFATTLPANAFPAVYGETDVERVASLAGRGTIDAMLVLGDDPDRIAADPDDLSIAEAAFSAYLAL
jgi:hypothetical protein